MTFARWCLVAPFWLALAKVTFAGAPISPARIELKIDWPVRSSPDVGFPVYCGLSLPKGRVASHEIIAVEDDGGQPVAASVMPLARWVPDPSLKWVGVRFLARRGGRYFAVIGQPSQEPSSLRVEAGADLIVIDTGKARFELPTTGPLFRRVTIDGRSIVDSAGGCLLLADQHGEQADETHQKNAPPAVVEYADKQFVLIRRGGELTTPGGRRLGGYVVRLSFLAGSTAVKIQHSFINTEPSDRVQYADLSLRLTPAGSNHRQALFEPQPGAEPVSVDLDIAAGDAAFMLQADYPHHGQKHYRRELMLRRGKAEFSPLSQQKNEAEATAGNWVGVATSQGGVIVAVPHFAELFPKEMEVSRDGLTAHLWSSRGGRLLDYRAATLADHYGSAWIESQFPGGMDALRKVPSDARGSARTHDVWLAFHAPAPIAELAELGRVCSQPPLCVQDPCWMRSTEAMGPVHPYDRERFPELERFLEHFFTDDLLGQEQRWGDYGFLDHGCGPHYYLNRSAPPGSTMPRAMYRYSGNMYHGQTALWQAYARTGRRMYHDYTAAFHRHNADYKFVHAALPGCAVGAQRGGGLAEETPLYWTGRARNSGVLEGHQGRDLEGFALEYFLTGDRWGLDAVLRFGEVFLRDFDPKVLTQLAAYSNGPQPTLSAAMLYQYTGDPRYLKKLEQIRDVAIDPQTQTGWVDTDYYGAWEKYPNKVVAVLADYLASQSPKSKRAFERAARIWLYDLPPNTTGYQCQDGRVCNFAWRLSGDLRYAQYIEARLNRALFEYVGPDGKFRCVTRSTGGPNLGGTHGFNFFETAFFGMDLLAATEGQRQPYVAFDAGAGSQPVEIWLAKDWHEPIALEARTAANPELQVRWTPDEPNRPYRDFHNMPIHWDWRPGYYSKSAPGLVGGYTKIGIGKETVAGEYRLLNTPLIFQSSAKSLVAVGRQGFVLRHNTAQPPSVYFLLPAGKRGGLFVNKPARLTIDRSSLDASPGEWTELTGADRDQIVRLTTAGLTYLDFRGSIPPVIAQGDAERFFIPREIQAEMPDREAAITAEKQSAEPMYVAGLTSRPGDRALSLTGKRSLAIPRGRPLGDRRYEFIDYTQGTLEFWFEPRWSTGAATGESQAAFLTGAFWPCSIRHYGGDDEDPRVAPCFQLLAAASQAPAGKLGLGYPPQELRNVTAVHAGSWHHFAVCWQTDPQRGWISELYIDGKPALGWARKETGLGRFMESERKRLPPLPWPIDLPGGEKISLVGSALNAVVDELRISDAPRYPKPFTALRQSRLDADDETRLLIRFDGDASAITPQAATPPRIEIR